MGLLVFVILQSTDIANIAMEIHGLSWMFHMFFYTYGQVIWTPVCGLSMYKWTNPTDLYCWNWGELSHLLNLNHRVFAKVTMLIISFIPRTFEKQWIHGFVWKNRGTPHSIPWILIIFHGITWSFRRYIPFQIHMNGLQNHVSSLTLLLGWERDAQICQIYKKNNNNNNNNYYYCYI